ncbi:putative gluconolactonase [Caenibius tardaugens NBRC 16725]|uniref:Putative gluconolactonase n=1 Tax=Caenibius tardaugens NBRC 16725 TaxID=1219035 RepID=U2ZWU6_9SPHN|nr:SMP-30/gluconolactonase/LRE family protein [Caenibius tardaugens]AZI37641.1 SMP-30/gluconolactonase/LRE family protein [Caenibius tardaugens NBRC 16725]GAD49824.1 putative gluconolactonase [Caenibius tardaugens NBRC 16725]
MVDVSICVNCANTLGEGPLWDVTEQRLYWIDSMAPQIWRCAVDGSDVRTWELPSMIGSMALREKGGAVLALANGFHFFDFESGALELIAHPDEGTRHVRLNDGKVDSRGRFLAGTLDMDSIESEKPIARRGVLYRLDTDLSVHPLEQNISVTNGPCWSLDNRTFYLTESSDDIIYAYDWDEDSGTLANRREFVRAAPQSIPDGATVDAEGFMWSTANGAFTGYGELRRYAPDGSLDRVVPMPSHKPTSVMFGGPDLDIAFVTTMRIPGTAEETPYDGTLLAVRGLGVRGVPERRFAG